MVRWYPERKRLYGGMCVGGVFLTEHLIYSAEMMETLVDPTLTLLGFSGSGPD